MVSQSIKHNPISLIHVKNALAIRAFNEILSKYITKNEESSGYREKISQEDFLNRLQKNPHELKNIKSSYYIITNQYKNICIASIKNVPESFKYVDKVFFERNYSKMLTTLKSILSERNEEEKYPKIALSNPSSTKWSEYSKSTDINLLTDILLGVIKEEYCKTSKINTSNPEESLTQCQNLILGILHVRHILGNKLFTKLSEMQDDCADVVEKLLNNNFNVLTINKDFHLNHAALKACTNFIENILTIDVKYYNDIPTTTAQRLISPIVKSIKYKIIQAIEQDNNLEVLQSLKLDNGSLLEKEGLFKDKDIKDAIFAVFPDDFLQTVDNIPEFWRGHLGIDYNTFEINEDIEQKIIITLKKHGLNAFIKKHLGNLIKNLNELPILEENITKEIKDNPQLLKYAPYDALINDKYNLKNIGVKNQEIENAVFAKLNEDKLYLQLEGDKANIIKYNAILALKKYGLNAFVDHKLGNSITTLYELNALETDTLKNITKEIKDNQQLLKYAPYELLMDTEFMKTFIEKAENPTDELINYIHHFLSEEPQIPSDNKSNKFNQKTNCLGSYILEESLNTTDVPKNSTSKTLDTRKNSSKIKSFIKQMLLIYPDLFKNTEHYKSLNIDLNQLVRQLSNLNHSYTFTINNTPDLIQKILTNVELLKVLIKRKIKTDRLVSEYDVRKCNDDEVKEAIMQFEQRQQNQKLENQQQENDGNENQIFENQQQENDGNGEQDVNFNNGSSLFDN